jgi:hypothetical protein
MGDKPRTIWLRLDEPLKEEILSHQTLLHIFFQDRWENVFKWTPRWNDIKTIFQRSWEVEDKNVPGGAWDEEFKEIAKEISFIKEYKLPVTIEYGGLQEVSDKEEEEGWRYKIEISILGDDEPVCEVNDGEMFEICFSKCQIKLSSLQKTINEYSWPVCVSKYCNHVNTKFISHEHELYDGLEGITFWIWVKKPPEGISYKAMCREIVGIIRTYIRNVVIDSKNIRRGIEDTGK